MTETTVTKKTAAKKAVTKKAVTKKAPTKKPAKTEKPDDIKADIIVSGKCNTLSGKSTLTYQTGADTEGKIYIRLTSCSGGGFFSKNEWVSVDKIKAVLESKPEGTALTSLYLAPVFSGKSSNNAGFLLAVLLNEGVVAPFEDGKKRHYVYKPKGMDAFMAKVNKRKATKAS